MVHWLTSQLLGLHAVELRSWFKPDLPAVTSLDPVSIAGLLHNSYKNVFLQVPFFCYFLSGDRRLSDWMPVRGTAFGTLSNNFTAFVITKTGLITEFRNLWRYPSMSYNRTAVRGRLQLSGWIYILFTDFYISVQVPTFFLHSFQNADKITLFYVP